MSPVELVKKKDNTNIDRVYRLWGNAEKSRYEVPTG